MVIGIDFDNTIACYDNVFPKLAQEAGLIPKGWKGSKQALRDFVRQKEGGELAWQKLQGQAYGAYMQNAEMFPGLANVLLRFKKQNIKIFIVSHKTIHGHFDEKKIPLRTAALQWMENKGFFRPEGFNIDTNHVFFNSTREEKVATIEKLGCDFFIDDLWELFAQDDFPANTKRILFSSSTNLPKEVSVEVKTNSWRQIGDHILGPVDIAEIGAQLSYFWENDIAQIVPLSGMGNSKIYKVFDGTSYFALKFYPDLARDDRKRLKTESEACLFLRDKGLPNVSKPIAISHELNMGLYEWIDGIEPRSYSERDIVQALEFIQKLSAISRQNITAEFLPASEACLSASDLYIQIERRLANLNSVKDNYPELSFFLQNDWLPLFEQFRVWASYMFPTRKTESRLPPSKQILSPSDFGFHNAIRVADESLVWIDMEYFGWDDPVKLTADFLLHPGMQLTTDQKKKWLKGCMDLFEQDEDFISRFSYSWGLYGFRWSLIILSEFLNEGWNKRLYANQELLDQKHKRLSIQLDKAKVCIDALKKSEFTCPYL